VRFRFTPTVVWVGNGRGPFVPNPMAFAYLQEVGRAGDFDGSGTADFFGFDRAILVNPPGYRSF